MGTLRYRFFKSKNTSLICIFPFQHLKSPGIRMINPMKGYPPASTILDLRCLTRPIRATKLLKNGAPDNLIRLKRNRL
jgi:hypothetical protein